MAYCLNEAVKYQTGKLILVIETTGGEIMDFESYFKPTIKIWL